MCTILLAMLLNVMCHVGQFAILTNLYSGFVGEYNIIDDHVHDSVKFFASLKRHRTSRKFFDNEL